MTKLTLARAGAAAIGLALASGAHAQETASHQVYELRQYKMVPEGREKLIDLFEREFVESQAALGIGMLGQFRDLDHPDRFTWIRSFESMPQRTEALQAFYFGPVWAAHREEANPLLDDNDNVLLLKPVWTSAAVDGGRLAQGEDLVFVTIHYLWKDPAEGFTDFFTTEMKPALEAAGLPVAAAFVGEPSENTFPQLPVRQSEKVFVWVTRAPSADAYAAAIQRVGDAPGSTVAARVADFEERSVQVLRLEPTAFTRAR